MTTPKGSVPNSNSESETEKVILDACCGGRMFWFNKQHPNALFVDHRECPPGHLSQRPNHSIDPDEVVDFRSMPFVDGAFRLVVFDPPHSLKRNGTEGIIAKKYGSLDRGNWMDDLRRGFAECWRVLMPYGVLVFKWSSAEIPLKDVLACFSVAPLFGHTTNAKGNTHWCCFMKLEESRKL